MNFRIALLILTMVTATYYGCKKDTKPDSLTAAYLVSGTEYNWYEATNATYQISNDTIYVIQVSQDSIFPTFFYDTTYHYYEFGQGMNYDRSASTNNYLCFDDPYCCNDTIRFFGTDSIGAYLYWGGLAGGSRFTLQGKKIQ